MMASTTHNGMKWVMRAGYGARGAIYVMVGGLAFLAAFKSVSASGTKDALVALRAQPYGIPALWLIGFGMLAYLVWRFIAGIADVEDHGTDIKGLFARLAQIITGALHGVIGIAIMALAWGGEGGSGGSAQDWTQIIMSMPAGRFAVAGGAVVLLGAGLYYAFKGWRGSYKSHLARSKLTQRVDPVLKAGLIIYGLMLALIALSLGFAALNADPSQAGGLGKALQDLRGVIFGRILLGGAGLGLLAFALYNFIEAAYRVVPKFSDPDIATLMDG